LKKILASSAGIILLLALAPVVIAQTPTTTVPLQKQITAEVDVLGTCDVGATDVDFGTMTPGSTSTQPTTVSQENGNTDGSLSIKGADWTDGTHSFGVGSTAWYTTGLPIALSTSFASVGTLAYATPLSVNLQLTVPPHQAASTGYTQTITFEVTC